MFATCVPEIYNPFTIPELHRAELLNYVLSFVQQEQFAQFPLVC